MPDRIAAVTYMCCAAVTGGELILSGADIGHIGAVVPVLRKWDAGYIHSARTAFISKRRKG